MARIRPADWVSTSAYAVDAEVYYNGLIYRCTTAVSSNSNGNAIPVDNTSWVLSGFWDIQDFYSLQEGIIEYANNQSTTFLNSIPRFIQRAHDDIKSVIRSPAMLVTRTLSVDANSSFRMPSDLIDLVHLRQDGTASGTGLAEDNAFIEIKPAQDDYEFETIKQLYQKVYARTAGFDYPRYRIRDGRCYIAGPELNTTHSVVLTYYQNPPYLGQTYSRIDQATGAALNGEGQTLAEWIADSEGHSSANFVQGTIGPITTNYFVAAFPNLMLLGALKAAEVYLKDSGTDLENIKAEYTQMLTEVQNQVNEFNNMSVSPQPTIQLL